MHGTLDVDFPIADDGPSSRIFAPRLSPAEIRRLAEHHESRTAPRLRKLWAYYRNPMTDRVDAHGRCYRLAQEIGLPGRIVGPGRSRTGTERREVVIENDIGWRVQAMVDFMFGKPVRILSTAADESTRRVIQQALDAVWEGSGGIALLQDAALLGHVYGHVDLILRAGTAAGEFEGAATAEAAEVPDAIANATANATPNATRASLAPGLETRLRAGEIVRVEVVEPLRGVPALDPSDFRRLRGYLIHLRLRSHAASDSGERTVTEVIEPEGTVLYVDQLRASARPNTLTPGVLPVVHIQNLAQPFHYEGHSEVEALMPLQDELNTRLSDRASRVTLQSFQMYLAKGVDGFEKSPVGPGMVWSTDNPAAAIEPFGGDADSPSEAAHILEIREALDKISGVPPLASGVVRAKIGNLTSANALRITMMGILSKTARKRVTYGRGTAEMSRLILFALNAMGVLPTQESDRGVRLEWPDPLPVDTDELVRAVEAKAALGASREQLLAELGQGTGDQGVA